ncbi:MAG: ionic transporter y4hA, partial [Acidipropionibacterium jensenii]|nr:ionic transporter y4hA [Acidipropionibacterium jensenii]
MGLVTLALTWHRDLPVVISVVVAIILAASVLSAVEHAEVVAARVGEPFGSLILAVAVTVIEVGLIIMLMTSSSGSETQSLARDTVFSAVMITCNGILGLSILAGTGRRKGESGRINEEGSAAALATVVVLAALTLVVPRFTTSANGAFLTGSQLAFEAVASIVVYVTFVMTQSVQHRDFFLPLNRKGNIITASAHADPPPTKVAMMSVGLLVCALIAVVGLAKVESPAIEAGVAAANLPQTFVGVIIALLVLAPETIAAYNAGKRGPLQVGI